MGHGLKTSNDMDISIDLSGAKLTKEVKIPTCKKLKENELSEKDRVLAKKYH